ncbi:hypothetical protein BD309DRAFT_1083033 [Dichomitus squalens]|nr:hypothetical protein BD309DRAFT_1083033 [Dichomitus squalens]
MIRTKQTARKSTGGKAPRAQYITDRSSDSDVELTEKTRVIRNRLENIFKSDLTFSGSSSFHRAYPEAPNPCLKITGIGSIGLPLHVRDAEAIKARAQQAPFGKATKTVVDKSVRDTWEIDGKQVEFENRAWAPFMDQVVRTVCETLGVNYDANQPRCDLYKLLLYEKGSHFKPHVDTEKADGMFATIVIVLPSRFSGGTVHVTHGDTSEVINCSVNSHTDTTVLAWYTDVQHEVKPITSGYRLALSFNLIHTTKSLRPALPSQSGAASRLRDVLTSWRDGDGGPSKIMYLLSHKYSQANLSGSALKGADAQLVSTLEAIARPLGFHLGFANLICTEHGYGDAMSFSDEISMIEVEETSVELENLVDLSGSLIRRVFEYDVNKEVIPEKFAREITSGEYDEQDDHGGYTGNEGATIDRIYLRTVVVIWPSWTHYDIVYGEDAFWHACEELESSTTTSPTLEENQLVQYILSRVDADDENADHEQAVSSVATAAACRWKDLALWKKTMDKCLPYLSLAMSSVEESIYTAVETFGFEAVESLMNDVLEGTISDVDVLEFLSQFESWTTGKLAKKVAEPIKRWIADRRTHRLTNLTVSSGDDYGLLVSLVLEHYDAEFLENSVVPQLKSRCRPSAIPALVHIINSQPNISSDARIRMTRDLMVVAVAKIDFYADYDFYERRSSTELATSFVEICLHCGWDDLLLKVLSRLMQAEGRQYGIETGIPVLSCIGEAARAYPASKPFPDVVPFAKWVVSSYLDVIAALPHEITASDLISICGALEAIGQSGLAETQLLPKLETLPISPHTLKSLLDGLHAKGKAIDLDRGPMKTVMSRLVTKYATIVDFRPTGWGHPNIDKHRVDAAHDALKYCVEVGVPDACFEVLQRLFSKSGELTAEFLRSTVIPLLKKLHPLLKKHKLRVTADPIAAPLRTLLLDWVGQVMGPQPSDSTLAPLRSLDDWTCACDYCPNVRRWLAESAESRHTFPHLGAPNRKHIEKFLKVHALHIATWQADNSRPQGLVVEKLPKFIKPMQWKENQSQGRKLLDAISTDARELQAILGPDYVMVATQLGADAPLASQGNTAAGPSKTIAKTTTNTTKKRLDKEAGEGSERPPPTKRKKKGTSKVLGDVIDLT